MKGTVSNSTDPKDGVAYFVDTLGHAESFVLCINISGTNPAHRKSANRHPQPYNHKEYEGLQHE